MTLWLFVLSQAALVAFGLPATFLPVVRQLSWASRVSCAYALGAVVLTLEGMLFTLAGWQWGFPALALPLLVLACLGSYLLLRRPLEPKDRLQIPAAIAVVSILTCATAALLLYQSVISGKAVSVDFSFFWGIKAARFAHAQAIDIPFLTWVYATHTHANYPPLFPTTLAWFALGNPDGLWKAAPLSTVIWFVAAIPLVFDCLRQRMADSAAAATTAFWSVALAAGITHAYSGGNAEAALIFFETGAIASLFLLPLRRGMDGVLPGMFMAGAVLTKLEGIVATTFILGGAYLVLLLNRRRSHWKPLAIATALPLIAAFFWFLFMIVANVPLRDPNHLPALGVAFDHLEVVLAEQVLNSSFGTRGLSWILPLAVIMVLAERWNWKLVVPLGLTTGLLSFTTFYYLQSRTDPSELIGWTFSHLLLPALSAIILAASYLLFNRTESEGAEG